MTKIIFGEGDGPESADEMKAEEIPQNYCKAVPDRPPGIPNCDCKEFCKREGTPLEEKA